MPRVLKGSEALSIGEGRSLWPHNMCNGLTEQPETTETFSLLYGELPWDEDVATFQSHSICLFAHRRLLVHEYTRRNR
jgi:hypothetical protein